MFAVPLNLLSRLRLRARPPKTAADVSAPRAGTHSRPSQPGQRAKSVRLRSWKGTAWLLAVNVVLLYVIDVLAFYHGRPMMTFAGLVPLIIANLVVTGIVTLVFAFRRLNAGSVVAALATVTFATVWLIGHNSGHNAYLASHLVSVTVAPSDQLPASSTGHMVIVSPDIATTKASQAMATGIAGQRNYSTYLQLGPATLQYVAGRMWYVLPLEFDGAGNKARLHGIEPGYIMVSAEDPDALPVEHYDGRYSMVVSLGGGQGSEPDRWAYSHGYSGYLLDDPTLELNDQGLPYYTVTLLAPRLGWTFFAPAGVLVIDAHTGQITRYALGAVPSWVDRVYSQQVAMTVANWYGKYADSGFAAVGGSNANRFQVSGHLTWMATYEPDGSNQSFVGIGFVDAYEATANNVVFGNSKADALQNYLSQLATEGNANGAAPEQGGQYQTVTGKIAAVGWDITGGQKYWYITLAGQPARVYVGTVTSVGPALVLAQPGDPVTIRILNTGAQESTATMQSFTDTKVPLQAPGS